MERLILSEQESTLVQFPSSKCEQVHQDKAQCPEGHAFTKA